MSVTESVWVLECLCVRMDVTVCGCGCVDEMLRSVMCGIEIFHNNNFFVLVLHEVLK